VAVTNTTSKSRKKISFINNAVSLLLICTVFLITIIQAFHHHHTTEHQADKYETSYHSNLQKCQVCEFLSHQNNTDYLIVDQFTLVYFQPIAKIIKGNIFTGIYPKALAAFTNKGPPSTV
jgi:uncharacterized membrane protein